MTKDGMTEIDRSGKEIDAAGAESRPVAGFSRRTAIAAAGMPGILACLTTNAYAADIIVESPSLEDALETLRTAMLAGNGSILEALLHNQLKYMHSSGLVQSKADLLRDLAGKRFFASLVYVEHTSEIVDGVGVALLTVDQVKNLTDGRTRASRIKVQMDWINIGEKWKLLTRASALISQSAPVAPLQAP